jgi:hypothetical protein
MSPRDVVDMTPTRLDRSAEGQRQALVRALSGIGDVLMPSDAEEPILATDTRAAVFNWLAELNFRVELAEAKLKPRTSALFFGPPGCGKTMLAHHIAARLGLPMLSVGAEHMTSKWVGEGSEKMAKLFTAIDAAGGKALLFIDEIDAVGVRRSSDGQASSREHGTVMTVLLRRLERSSAIVIAATNREDDLDPALFRRFNLQISVGLPGFEERWAILRHYFTPYAPDEELLDTLALATEGTPPSVLRQVVETLKRAIVLAKPLRQPVPGFAADALRPVVGAVRPPSDFGTPPLWEANGLSDFTAFPWPPQMDAAS